MDNVKITDYTMSINRSKVSRKCCICKQHVNEMYIYRFNHSKPYYMCRQCIQKVLLYGSLLGDSKGD